MPLAKLIYQKAPDQVAFFLKGLKWTVREDSPQALCLEGSGKRWRGWSARFGLQGDLAIWAGDGMQVDPPAHLSSQVLYDTRKICQYCKTAVKPPERIVRLGFAGRACQACREKLAPTIEFPGWNR